jgi:hypothetical protein
MIKFAIGSTVRLIGQLGVDLTGLTVSFVFEPCFAESYAGQAEYVINLTAQAAQTRAATVTDAAGGVAQYTLTAGDTAAAGRYRGQFQFLDASQALQIFPKTGGIDFEVLDVVAAPGQFLLVTDLTEPVRAIMGDFKTPYQYEDSAIASVVRSMVRMGMLPGFGVAPDGLTLAPALVKAADLALLTYHSAKTLLRPNVRAFGWRTRAMSVRKGDQRDFLWELQLAIYNLEFGEQFASFQTYYAWVNSLAGINVWGLMSEMKVSSPVATVMIGTGGIQINTT